MRASIHALLLVGCTVFSPPAHAQIDYRNPVAFAPLVAESGWAKALAPGASIFSYSMGGVATDALGNVYVSDSVNGAIRKVSPEGAITTLAAFSVAPDGGQRPADIAGADALATDVMGNVYVIASHAHTVCRIAPDGATTVLAAGLPLPVGLAVDTGGNVYVSDDRDHALRKITPDGQMTIFAGQPGEPGSADGTTAARFRNPSGLAVDSSGVVFVADCGNHTIRKITPEGVVSTLAGFAGTFRSTPSRDGVGASARFAELYGLAIDRNGTLYATEYTTAAITATLGGWVSGYIDGIRRITPDGSVDTIHASPATFALIYGSLEYGGPYAIAIDNRGAIYLTDWWFGDVLKSDAPPWFAQPLASQTVGPDRTAAFGVAASGTGPISYQWLKDGGAIPGATEATLTLRNIQDSDLGSYAVRLTNAVGGVVSNPATLSFPASNAEGLVNLSIRSSAGSGADTVIVGFVVGGIGTTGTKPLLIRGVGPTLGTFGMSSFLADPMLGVFSGFTLIAANDNWSGEPAVSAIGAQVGAFALASSASRDAALYHAGLPAASYTVQLSGVGGTTGVALAEIYDATPAGTANVSTPRLINLSARTPVGTGADILIAGFGLGGTTDRTLLIRAIGPTLGAFGVTGALADPRLELFQGTSLLQSNDNWGGDALVTSATAKTGAFPLDDASHDAALLITLPPGSYTARVSGVASTTGVALVEIYEVP